jgi:hypothetical protein
METTNDLADQVQKALVAHGAWKVRLAQAIESGASESSPEAVRKDNQCVLGKWLYGEISPALKRDEHYEAVRRLHAEFHVAAAAVLALALEGRKGDAQAAMQSGQAFGRASTQLTLALSAWQSSVKG